MATTDTALPRRLKGRVSAVASALSAGPDGFLASREAGPDASRQCLASLFSLAASLHTARLPYHAKAIETSRARHVTLEQVWGQMHMLLRPVMRRLQENVRHAQRTFGATVKTRGVKRPRGDGDGDGDGDGEGEGPTANGSREEDMGIGRDILSANTSDLGESDLDDEMAQLLAEKKRRRRERAADKKASKGDKSWRYAFGKAPDGEDDEEAEDDDDEEEEEAEEENAKGAYEGESRRNNKKNKNKNNNSYAEGEDDDDDDDDDEAAAREEAAALKEMYGDDFDSADADGLSAQDREGEDGEEDPLLEEDLQWDDPSGAFDERDVQYWGRGDMLDPDDAGDYGEEEDDAAADPTRADRGQCPEDRESDEESGGNEGEENMTALERERRRERRLVERLEAQRLHGAQWALRGEATGRDRPRDALLDESLDFDHAMRAVPVATAAATARLEDRVRRRVLDGRFDDVARRAALSSPGDLMASSATATATATAAGRSAHDAEKSKLSLMDLYEKEFLERAQRAEGANGAGGGAVEAEPLTEVEKDELRAIHMWRRLAQHLDALSNFHYTPRPVQEDLAARVRAVDGQAPAIAVETVGNFATTRAAALAPQDLFRGADRKYADVGSAELVPHERRALRRAKKNESSNKRHMKEQRVSKAKKAKQEQRQLTEGTK